MLTKESKRVSRGIELNINAIDFTKKGAKLKNDWKIFHLSGKNLLYSNNKFDLVST